MPGLDSLSDADLEHLSSGNLNGLSDQGLEIVAGLKDAPNSGEKSASSYGDALLTNHPTTGIKQDLVRSAPAMALSIPGSVLGAAAAGPLGGIVGAGVAGATGEGLRQAAVGLYAINKNDEANYPVPSPSEMNRNIAAQGGLAAAGEGAGLLLGPLVRGAGRALVNNPVARAVGNYSADAAERLLSRPAEVMAQMGEGRVGQAAKAFKGAVSKMVDDAGTAYENLISQVTNGEKYGPGFRINLQNGVGDQAAKIAQEYGYGQPGRMGAEAASQEKFLAFARRLNELSDATPEQVYWFQRDLGNAARSSADPVLKSALGKLKGATMDHLGARVPEIGEANSGYRAVMELNDELGAVTNADDAAKIIKSRMAGNGEVRAAIEAAAEKNPGIKAALDTVLDANAATPFSRGVPDIPRTGFGATVLAGVNHVFNPAAVLTGIAGAPGVSPLATAYAVRAASAIESKIPAGTYKILSTPTAGAMAPNIANFYGSPATP